jgi:hypothetical protein
MVNLFYSTTKRDAVGAARTKIAHLRITEAGRQAIAE